MSKIIKEQIKVREGTKEIVIRILRTRGGEKNILPTKQEQGFSFLLFHNKLPQTCGLKHYRLTISQHLFSESYMAATSFEVQVLFQANLFW